MSRRMILGFFLCLLFAPAMLKAQPAPDQGGNQGGDGGNRRRTGGGGGGGGGGGMRGGNDTPVGKAMQSLRETLDNKEATADDIGKKLTELRDAREKAKTELATAQKDLKEVLTQRQEAVLVMMGQLE